MTGLPSSSTNCCYTPTPTSSIVATPVPPPPGPLLPLRHAPRLPAPPPPVLPRSLKSSRGRRWSFSLRPHHTEAPTTVKTRSTRSLTLASAGLIATTPRVMSRTRTTTRGIRISCSGPFVCIIFCLYGQTGYFPPCSPLRLSLLVLFVDICTMFYFCSCSLSLVRPLNQILLSPLPFSFTECKQGLLKSLWMGLCNFL